MPFDGIFTSSIVNEISYLIDSRIDKIHQPSKDEIVLHFKKDKRNPKIFLCANPSYPRAQLTEENKENPQVAPTFCMILRKHLTGARLMEVNQVNFDRIIELKFESRDELGYINTYSLLIEIMGKHSNIILLNSSNRIVDSIKHVGSDINRYREVLPGVNYVSPPTGEKLNPMLVSKDELLDIIENNHEINIDKIFVNSFLGISKVFAGEICGSSSGIKAIDLSEQNIEQIAVNFYYYMSRIKSSEYSHLLYYRDNAMTDYYVFPLNAYAELKSINFESSSKLLDMFYSQKNLKDNLKQKYNDIFKLISNLIERNNKKIQIHLAKLEECRDYEKYKVYGDIIMANQFNIRDDMEKVDLENFYDPEYGVITVPLEIGLSPVLNAQKHYKKYAKEKSTIDMVTKQLEESHDEHIYLESIAYNLENANDIETIEEIRRELSELGYIKRKRLDKKQPKSSPNHYKSSDGYDIYVGKNNVQNDYLTTKFASPNDIWMHTKNIPGSHVIIKSQNGVSDTALLEGALLAAYYSKAKNSTTVPVDYTERKNVKKPSGAKPGMVIYYTNKTAYVTPEEEKISKFNKID